MSDSKGDAFLTNNYVIGYAKFFDESQNHNCIWKKRDWKMDLKRILKIIHKNDICIIC